MRTFNLNKYKNLDRIFHLEGNGGGDILNFAPTESNDTVYIKVGHCCVYTVNHILPVELLTLILSQAEETGFDKILEESGWSDEYVEQLKNKIIKLGERTHEY